jgi:DNA-directed RNA polymerase specialized sigma24 family protein
MLPHATKALANTNYAVTDDFCKIFAEETDSLYLLALLLTGDHARAQECFVSALHDCLRAKTVFGEWAHSWARRTVVCKAIELIDPRRRTGYSEHGPTGSLAKEDVTTAFSAILGLENFDRFAFVMTVLEKFSDLDCKVLLECSRQDLVDARIRAMRSVAGFLNSPPKPQATLSQVAPVLAHAS